MGKKYLNKKKTTEQTPIKLNLPFSLYIPAMIAILAFMLYVRIALPWDSVFLKSGFVNFAADDAVYHMRLVENTIANYPNRIVYDPFTHFPFSSKVHFAPLWTLIIATTAIIFGARSPTDPIIYTVGALIPAILGSFVVIAVYYAGKTVYHKNVGLLSSICLAVLGGQFLSRTVIGFSDHHVAEIFFSTLTMTFYALALNELSKDNYNLRKNWWIYSVLAGFSLASYLLCWMGGSLFAAIILIYGVIQSTIRFYHNQSCMGIAKVSIITLTPPLIAILPYVEWWNVSWTWYSLFHVVSYSIAILIFALIVTYEKLSQRYNLNPLLYPVFLASCMFTILVIVYVVKSNLVNALFSVLFGVLGSTSSTISEVQGMLFRGNQFSLAMLYGNFGLTFFIAVIGLCFALWSAYRSQRVTEIFFVVWCSLVVGISLTQNRFAYYSAINVALLFGYFWYKVFNKLKWNLSKPSWLTITALVLFIALLYPSYAMTTSNAYGGGESPDWIESLQWLRNNTPDVGIDYYGTYVKPNNTFYPYPPEAYGVMSWWDYGHIITYIGHRIPNANPFQHGIIEFNRTGAAPFLTAENETEANRIADALGVRYIISDAAMASGKFWAIGTFAKNNSADECYSYYYQQVRTQSGLENVYSQHAFDTMTLKLHFFDGDHANTTKNDLDHNYLQHYRLVYESRAVVGSFAGHDIHYVKIFEYVKGATIRGNATPNSSVYLSLSVVSNQGRAFTYEQQTVADSSGGFSFIVPYANGEPLSGQTNYAVKASGSYWIEYGSMSKGVMVTESKVLGGGVVQT